MDVHLKQPRRCTDVLFLLFFVVFWIAMFVLGFYGVGTGNPKILLFGTDYRGQVCGNGDNENYKTRYFVNPGEIMFAAGIHPTYSRSIGTKYNLRDAKSICLKDCPKPKNATAVGTVANTVNWVCDYPVGTTPSAAYTKADWESDSYDYYSQLTATQQSNSRAMKGPCYPVLFETANTFYTCQYYGYGDQNAQDALAATSDYSNAFGTTPLSTFTKRIGDQIEEMLSGPLATVERYIDDFTTGWKVVVVAGGVCPIVLSILFLFFLRYFTGLFAYTVLFSVNALAVALTIYLFLKAGVIGSDEITAYVSKASSSAADAITNYADPAEKGQDTLKIIAYVVLTFTIIFFLFSMMMLRRVKVAVGVIKVATSAVGKMPTITLFPIVPAVMMVLLFVYWLFTFVFLYASGEIKMQDCTMDSTVPPMVYCVSPTDTSSCHCGYQTSWDRNLQGVLAYYLFGFLWGSQWIIAMCYLIIACVFVQYYFKSGDYNALKNFPLVAASKKMTYFHSGTAAFGSFFVAILQFIRIFVRFIVHRLKKLKKDSKIIKYAGYYVEYCLWYLQKCIEWLNRNAYIMTAIDGTSFCTSAWNGLALLVKNIMSVATVNIVGDIMLFLGKLVVCLGSGVIAFGMLDSDTFSYGDEKVSSPLFIVIVVCLFAYLIASVFMSIVELGIDTILLCYCKDTDDNGGTPLNAPPALVKALGMAKKVKAIQAQEAKDRAARAAAE